MWPDVLASSPSSRALRSVSHQFWQTFITAYGLAIFHRTSTIITILTIGFMHAILRMTTISLHEADIWECSPGPLRASSTSSLTPGHCHILRVTTSPHPSISISYNATTDLCSMNRFLKSNLFSQRPHSGLPPL